MDQSSIQLETTHERMIQPTFSIILPVYNKEVYIKRCIQSILQQSYSDFELIIINDGSTDQSGKEIQNSILTDQRVKVYRYENSGVSMARNRGIEYATGKYLLFIDADDWIEKNYLETIINQLTVEADIYIWGITKEHNNKQIEVIPTAQGKYNQFDFLRMFVDEQYNHKEGLYGYIPNKLIKTSIIKEYNIRFNPNLRKLEDYDFYLSCYAHCQTFVCFPYTGYHYIYGTQNSSGQLVKQVDYVSLIDIHHKCYSLLEGKKALTESNEKTINQAMGQLVIAVFLDMNDVTKVKIKELEIKLKNRIYPLKALAQLPTSFVFLKRNILKENTTIIYIYLLLWRSYLSFRRKFV